MGAPPTAVYRSAKGIIIQNTSVLTAHEESEHDEHAHIRRNSCRDSEDDEE
jgi:hypothetical protein